MKMVVLVLYLFIFMYYYPVRDEQNSKWVSYGSYESIELFESF